MRWLPFYLLLPFALISNGDNAADSEVPPWVPREMRKRITDGFDYGPYKVNQEYPYSKGPFRPAEEYDFIIVGSGAAGSVLANRLSEIPTWKILLLEAGKPETPYTDIPLMAAWWQLTDYNWGYRMAKEEGICLAMTDQRCAWPRGKALGGTSVINYMIYTRGNRRDFDTWAAQGNPGWSWDEVLPYYMRSENAKLKRADPGFHGTGGYLNVEDVRYRTKLAKAFINAAKQNGHKILDYNGREQLGFSMIQSTTRKGLRCSAAKAFIQPAEKRTNLRILPMSRVSKVLINPETKQAYGVEYTRNKQKYTAYANKEVILSAGPIASPQLLMLSGIGPKAHLEEMKIPVVQNLAVGEMLEDHAAFLGLTFLVNQSVAITPQDILSSDAPFRYIYNGTGPVVVLGGVEALGYIKTNVSTDMDNFPDIELIFLSGGLNSDGGGAMKDGIHMRQDYYDALYKSINFNHTWSILPMLLHPKSRGYMRLQSTNVYHHPIMYGRYLTDPEGKDMATMVASIRAILQLSETEAFQKYGSTLHPTPYPGCENHIYLSDAYWECGLRRLFTTLHHQVATCRMGPATDPNAVVDARLRVYGISNLRVVDTSIIPFALSAHTNAPAFMIGEKAADYIKLDWNGFGYQNNSVYI